ncbi:MAG: polysaccharide biosynthesis tyrosine autokinase [Deltaproteobacteria bacterium]|nr:polysaccharide biosynthesis tyrosine autokinase [Deltaproteobacteria bacterium]
MLANQKAPMMEELHLLDYWRTIVKRRLLILTCLLTVLTAAVIYLFTAVPVYRGTTQILIERANPNILSAQEMFAIDPSGQDFYQTQYKVLESRAIARDVIGRLRLESNPEYKAAEGGFSLRGLLSGLLAKKPPAEGDSLPGDALSAMKPEADTGLVSAFQSRLKISPVRNSRIVEINFESIDPRLAALGANTVAQAYIDWNLGLRIKSSQSASVFLDEQVKQAKQKMEASEQAIQQYREKYGVSIMTNKTDSGQQSQDISRQRLSQVSTQLMESTNRRMEAEIKYNKALDLVKNPESADSIPEVAMNPIIISMKDKEVQMIRERTVKAGKYGPKHPEMVALNQELDNLRALKKKEIQNIVDSLKANYDVALKQERALTQALRASEGETISRDKIAIQFQVLQQEAESNRQLYDLLLKRLKESSVTEENRTVNIYIVDRAEVPTTAVRPKKAMGLLIALVLGLGLGLGLAFFVEYLDDTLKSPEDLERHLSLPYLGSLPHFDFKTEAEGGSDLLVLDDPRSQAAESYRGLRTGILFSTPDRSPRTILVTSATASEGKTITSVNIALVMASAGERTLLVDLDMRRPRLHKSLKVSNERGVSNILVGDSDWRTFVQQTPVANLHFISSGPIAPNPAELIASERMKSLIHEWAEAYDRVIIDTAPITAVTDPVLLSRLVDGTVILIQAGGTSRRIIAAGIRQIQAIQGRVLGAILNNVDTHQGGYYYQYYKHYYYGEGDKSGKKKTQRHHKKEKI